MGAAGTGHVRKTNSGDMEKKILITLNDQGGGAMSWNYEELSATLRAEMSGHPPVVVISAGFCPEGSAKTRGIGYQQECSPTLRGGVTPAVLVAGKEENEMKDKNGKIFGMSGYGDFQERVAPLRASGGDHGNGSENLTANAGAVRRLTPLECERLQGFPDGWTDIGEWTDSKGKRHKDSDAPRYKALGNSIALPFWFWLLRRISAQYERPATLGSLFDGIGGFPLCWERCNGKGSAIWASEIEEFPIAVTKKRFPEGDG